MAWCKMEQLLKYTKGIEKTHNGVKKYMLIKNCRNRLEK
jgi:hypothetical protein